MEEEENRKQIRVEVGGISVLFYRLWSRHERDTQKIVEEKSI
jgi:hypothetical protein